MTKRYWKDQITLMVYTYRLKYTMALVAQKYLGQQEKKESCTSENTLLSSNIVLLSNLFIPYLGIHVLTIPAEKA